MLKDKVFEDLGFYKDRNYRKRKNGVSSFSWFWGSCEILTIEKHHVGCYDEGETFYPTFRHNNMCLVVDNLKDLNLIISLFRLTEKDGKDLDKLEEHRTHLYADIGFD
jgi:hypothetical protein